MEVTRFPAQERSIDSNVVFEGYLTVLCFIVKNLVRTNSLILIIPRVSAYNGYNKYRRSCAWSHPVLSFKCKWDVFSFVFRWLVVVHVLCFVYIEERCGVLYFYEVNYVLTKKSRTRSPVSKLLQKRYTHTSSTHMTA